VTLFPCPDSVIRPASILLLLLLPASADKVILSDGSQLSGTVTALADSGEVHLESDLAFAPFQVRADHLKRVDFSGGGSAPDPHDCMVTLANGDQFPADLTGVDDTTVTVRTGFSGDLRLPRESIGSVQLGVRPRKTIYSGPADANGWTINNGWRYDTRRFAADSSGTLSREFDIPGSFALKFRLTWRSTPNLQIYFASDSFETTGKANRYFLQFASAGFELKRQDASGNGAYLSMATIHRNPSDFEDSAVDVEILVDRKMGEIHLYLDGEKTGEYRDPTKSIPMGQGIMFRSLIGDDYQSVSRIEVREWDASAARHQGEERGDTARDVVITRSSDRGTGSILSMTPSDDGGTLRYKGPHHPEPVDLPLSEISTLFFARPGNSEGPPVAAPPFQLGLRGRGWLGVNGCIFNGDQIAAKHPLLGDLVIRRDAVASLQRDTQTAGDDEPEPDDE
jgi:hypothetical protein